MTMIDDTRATSAHALMTPRTCKAARVLLAIEQIDLAARAGVNVQTLRNYENEARKRPAHETWLKIKRALEREGIIFIDEDDVTGPGVRLRRPTSTR
jgi:DNA-binding XRE family transcriptional regulator